MSNYCSARAETHSQGIDLDTTHTIRRIIHYPVVYWWEGRGLVGNGNSSYAVFQWQIDVHRLDSNVNVGLLLAAVGIKRGNSTGWVGFCNVTTVMLTPGGSTSVSLFWWEDGTLSQNFAPNCIWNMTATVSVVTSNAYDVDLSNNEIADPVGMEARNMLIADIKVDGIVDIYDAIKLSNRFGAFSWIEGCTGDEDLNCDGAVDIYDAIILANNFDNHIP